MLILDIPEGMNSFKNETYDIPISDGPQPVGKLTFKPLTGKCCKLGYEVLEEYRNKGYATKALHQMIDYLFNECWFETIITGVEVTNLPSIKVLWKNGFRVDYVQDNHFQVRLEKEWEISRLDAFWKASRIQLEAR